MSNSESLFSQDGLEVFDNRIVVGGDTFLLSAITSIRWERASLTLQGWLLFVLFGIISFFLVFIGLRVFGYACGTFVWLCNLYRDAHPTWLVRATMNTGTITLCSYPSPFFSTFAPLSKQHAEFERARSMATALGQFIGRGVSNDTRS